MKFALCAALLITASIISGCAGSIDFKDTLAVSSAIKVEYDSLDKVTKYSGPEYSKRYNKLWGVVG